MSACCCTNALLIDAGYTVSRYVSLEQAIAESADAYYQALLDSTHGWHESQADTRPTRFGWRTSAPLCRASATRRFEWCSTSCDARN